MVIDDLRIRTSEESVKQRMMVLLNKHLVPKVELIKKAYLAKKLPVIQEENAEASKQLAYRLQAYNAR